MLTLLVRNAAGIGSTASAHAPRRHGAAGVAVRAHDHLLLAYPAQGAFLQKRLHPARSQSAGKIFFLYLVFLRGAGQLTEMFLLSHAAWKSQKDKAFESSNARVKFNVPELFP